MSTGLTDFTMRRLDLWVQENLDDDEFVARNTHDAALISFLLAHQPVRKRITAECRGIRPHIKHFFLLREA